MFSHMKAKRRKLGHFPKLQTYFVECITWSIILRASSNCCTITSIRTLRGLWVPECIKKVWFIFPKQCRKRGWAAHLTAYLTRQSIFKLNILAPECGCCRPNDKNTFCKCCPDAGNKPMTSFFLLTCQQKIKLFTNLTHHHFGSV